MRSCIICTLHEMYYYGDKMKGVRWVGQVAHMGEMVNAYEVLVRAIMGRNHLEVLDLYVRMLLKLIFKN